MALENRLLSKFLDDINHNRLALPTLPEVALKVRKIVEDPTASAAQISVVIGSDPVLSAKLLQVANSPMYRAARPIENLQAAIARLGCSVVRNIVTGIVMEQLYQNKSGGNKKAEQKLRELWLHSTKVGAIAHVIARKFTDLKADQAMLGGLIHDIGAIPIYCEADNMPELMEDDERLGHIVHKLHTLIGTSILDEWNFPQELIEVVAEHENLERESGERVDYVDVVTVANLHSYIGTDHPLAQRDWSEIPAFKKIGLTPEESIDAMEEAREEVSIMQKMLS